MATESPKPGIDRTQITKKGMERNSIPFFLRQCRISGRAARFAKLELKAEHCSSPIAQ
jgi:hypothetical protein